MKSYFRLGFLTLVLVAFSSAASAAEWRHGQAVVDAVDPTSRTITIDGEVYGVPSSCRIQRVSGVTAALSEIRAIADSSEVLVPSNVVDFVEYQAIEGGSGWDMVELTILEGPVQ